jgi:hypothetical protein
MGADRGRAGRAEGEIRDTPEGRPAEEPPRGARGVLSHGEGAAGPARQDAGTTGDGAAGTASSTESGRATPGGETAALSQEEQKRLEAERKAAAEAAEQAAREQAAREAAERAVASATAAGGFNVGGVFREVARPRLVGSHGAVAVAGTIRSCFEALGYEVEEQEFRFNPLPGRFGLPALGGLHLVAGGAAAALLYSGYPVAALAVLALALVAAVLLALFATRMIDSLQAGSIPGMNMMARRPGARPRYVIMAHRDSKSQPVPLAFRGAAIGLAVLSWLALLLVALASMTMVPDPTLVLVAGGVAVLSGVGLVFCWADDRSDGALDNASGVVAALNVAAREADAGDVAFLITDAEEMGLAGARAAAPLLPPVFGVINLDGLDDEGSFYVLERFGLWRKKGLAPHLAAALLQEAEFRGEAADRRDLPAGIPTDHIPLVRAGIPALTLMRGTRRSLRRVHRPADSADSLQGDGIRRATDLLCGALARLREQSRPLER